MVSYSFFDFNAFSFDIYVEELFSKVFIHILLLLTTFNPPLKQ